MRWSGRPSLGPLAVWRCLPLRLDRSNRRTRHANSMAAPPPRAGRQALLRVAIAVALLCSTLSCVDSLAKIPTRHSTSVSLRDADLPSATGAARPDPSAPGAAPAPARREPFADSLATFPWPEGAQVLRFEDLEGAILVPATLRSMSGRDTAGILVFDTGAGFLAVDVGLAGLLGIADSAVLAEPIALASRPLPRLQLGGLQFDQVSPVLTVDAGIVRRVTGRPVLGLLGQSLLVGWLVVLDYSEGVLVMLPSVSGDSAGPAARGAAGHAGRGAARPLPPPVLAGVLSPRAAAVPFSLEGDGKVVVRARVTGGAGGGSSSWLNLIVDTGATKSVFFRSALDRALRGWTCWPAVHGLSAPTLTGDAGATVVRVPELVLDAGGRGVTRRDMDAAVIGGDLGRVLSGDVGQPVAGLLGYSFLKHFRVAMDFARGLLWLDPARGDVPDRPFEYSHVGLQLESVGDTARVAAVAVGSPAAEAGIRPGDRVLELDGESVAGTDVVALGRRLEGPPATFISLTLVRDGREWTCRLARKRLL